MKQPGSSGSAKGSFFGGLLTVIKGLKLTLEASGFLSDLSFSICKTLTS